MGRIEKMEPLDFQELIQKREDWVKSSKENKFNFDSILAGLYNDPSHFIFEILQNAEDAGAKTIIFKLDENQLEISHDAEKIFNADDIAAITGIGISTKKEDINAIGKFGVGFKSVFAITQTPMIHSGKYHFEINDFVVPSPIKGDDLPRTTKIILPFNHKSRSREQVFALVQDKLENLGLQSLLFLRSIDEIKWQSPNKSGHYLKSSKVVDNILVIKRVTVISETDNKDKETLQDYLVIEKVFELDKKSLKVEVAFQIGKDDDTVKEIIVPVNDAKLTVYFPTEKDIYLKFLIQGPYKTTPNRENIPLDDEQNKFITEQIGELVSESISVLKKAGYLDLNLLNILPLEEEYAEKSPIYATIYEKVKSKLSSDEDLLPTHDGKFTTSEDTLLAGSQDLVKILTKTDIQFLFKKNNWLNTNITSDRTKKLRDYLVKVIGIKEVDFEDFAKNVTFEFFTTKNDEWMINFYNQLSGQVSLWRDAKSYPYRRGILRSKPFIRLENNSHIAPFNEKEDVQVYLPSKTESKYPTVKKTLTENQEVLGFLKNLGLSEPDLFAEIREFIIPKYESDKPDIEDGIYFEDFHKLLIAYIESHNNQQRQELLVTLEELPIIKAINPTTNHYNFVKPNAVYANTPEIRLYFKDYESAYFVSEELHSRFNAQDLEIFLKELGVSNEPRRIIFNPDLSSNPDLRIELQEQSGKLVNNQDVINYNLEGLIHFLEQQVSLERSKVLWNFLIQAIQSKTPNNAKNYFEAEYKWFHYKNRSYRFDASFKRILQQNHWVLDRQSNLCSPSEINFSELSDEYNTDCSNLDVLKEILGFKPDAFDQLPEDMKKKIELTEGYSAEELASLIGEYERKKKEKEEEIWEPQFSPNDIHVNIENINPEVIPSPELEGQIDWPTDGWENSNSHITETSKSPETLKDIGKWGEQYVFNALKMRLGNDATMIETEYGCRISNNGVEQKIHWLNIIKEVGEGYDLVIVQGDEEIEYIEVKTTTEDKEELIIISGTQWEFARKLFKSGEGNKYVIYRVFNAGKSNAQIIMVKNPFKLWQEGKLYAHPIRLKL